MENASLQPILALLGDPVAGNPTQYMIEKVLAHHELEWRYLSLEVKPDDLGDAVRGMRAMGFAGGNLADPHKSAAIEHLDGLDRTAELVRTVNAFHRDGEKLLGENTEGRALVEAVRRRSDPAGRRVVVLGAGRMASAVAVELAAAGPAEIVIVARTVEHGSRLVELLNREVAVPATLAVWEGDYELPHDAGLLVQATSIGREDPDAEVPLVLDRLGPHVLVADVTVNPPRTRLVREAEERGAETVDGLEIFVQQAAINFRQWTGVDPDAAVLSEAVEEFLEL